MINKDALLSETDAAQFLVTLAKEFGEIKLTYIGELGGIFPAHYCLKVDRLRDKIYLGYFNAVNLPLLMQKVKVAIQKKRNL